MTQGAGSNGHKCGGSKGTKARTLTPPDGRPRPDPHRPGVRRLLDACGQQVASLPWPATARLERRSAGTGRQHHGVDGATGAPRTPVTARAKHRSAGTAVQQEQQRQSAMSPSRGGCSGMEWRRMRMDEVDEDARTAERRARLRRKREWKGRDEEGSWIGTRPGQRGRRQIGEKPRQEGEGSRQRS
jgi:hypothetical protein